MRLFSTPKHSQGLAFESSIVSRGSLGTTWKALINTCPRQDHRHLHGGVRVVPCQDSDLFSRLHFNQQGLPFPQQVGGLVRPAIKRSIAKVIPPQNSRNDKSHLSHSETAMLMISTDHRGLSIKGDLRLANTVSRAYRERMISLFLVSSIICMAF